MKIFQFNRCKFIEFFIIFIQNGIKRMGINLWMKQKIHAATVRTAFFLISVETDIQLCENIKNASKYMSLDSLERLFR